MALDMKSSSGKGTTGPREGCVVSSAEGADVKTFVTVLASLLGMGAEIEDDAELLTVGGKELAGSSAAPSGLPVGK